MTHTRTDWLTDPTGHHLATYHGATDTDGECWTVSLIAPLDSVWYGDTDTAECPRCCQCDAEVHNDVPVARPSDGQGDFICLPCLLADAVAVVSLTPDQAAALSWWDTTQPTPADLGLTVPRWA